MTHRPQSLRCRRIADSILATLSELLTRKLTDPGLSGVFPTEVVVTADLRVATVYYRLLDHSAEARENASNALGRATGYLRRELGRHSRLRVTPELRFRLDITSEHVEKIERLLYEVREDLTPRESIDEEE